MLSRPNQKYHKDFDATVSYLDKMVMKKVLEFNPFILQELNVSW